MAPSLLTTGFGAAASPAGSNDTDFTNRFHFHGHATMGRENFAIMSIDPVNSNGRDFRGELFKISLNDAQRMSLGEADTGSRQALQQAADTLSAVQDGRLPPGPAISSVDDFFNPPAAQRAFMLG